MNKVKPAETDNRLLKWLNSFRYAYEGMRYALITQRNMKIHFALGVVALVAAWILDIAKTGILWIMLAITLVITTELMNTAVEKTVDLAMPHPHPGAKIAKDLAAAAVLIAAIFATAVGIIVFWAPVVRLFG